MRVTLTTGRISTAHFSSGYMLMIESKMRTRRLQFSPWKIWKVGKGVLIRRSLRGELWIMIGDRGKLIEPIPAILYAQDVLQTIQKFLAAI